jgi:hypothetical protein
MGDDKIELLGSRVAGVIDDLRDLKLRFSAIEARLGRIEARFSAIETRFATQEDTSKNQVFMVVSAGIGPARGFASFLRAPPGRLQAAGVW